MTLQLVGFMPIFIDCKHTYLWNSIIDTKLLII